ncbi:leukocidin family pore-forming toxin [Aeromonas popoffii]|uniref:Leukocidin family pore-forming toxin n=1 Tax=Aeromonas popoffii TaxID=70856 RepID=A0ABS5GKJ7_9GAMM|nr:leukocidin family pore-forming toxin [Aeromonas popoffii]MBR7627667.1 leukocidin family pore-forming toxin [Aeromonas popoffii]
MKNKKPRKFITRVPTLSLLTLALLAGSVQAEDIGERTDQGISMLASLQSEQGLVYFNASIWLDEQQATKGLTPEQLHERVLVKGERVFIDFSAITDKDERQQAKKAMERLTGISFDADWVLVSAYKGALLFTPLGGVDDPAFYQVMERVESLAKRGKRSLIQPAAADASLPHVAFYLNVNHKITDAECTFPRSIKWDKGNRVFCDSANISLVYRVNLMRSLQFGSSGTPTPDAKLVRISLDEESAGAGIQLNNALSWSGNSGIKWGGWIADWGTNAIAQDYNFTIAASNTKASVLKSQPNNLNTNYDNREISGFEVGVSGGGEVNKDGPKVKLDASAKFSQSRQLAYNTQDYRVERSAPSAQKVSFSWVREQYASADSLLVTKQSLPTDLKYYVDHSRIKPLSYKGFVPNLDVIYKAKADETGTTVFNIDSSVNIRPIYTGAKMHTFMWAPTHATYHGLEETDKRRRVTVSERFTVNWNHPVFTGGRPVNLQLGGFNNRCLSVNTQQNVSAVTCDEKSADQSFIYDRDGRYVSARDTGYCLDASNLGKMQICSSDLRQHWEWKPNSDALSNKSTHQLLGHNTQTGALALYDENGQPGGVSLRTLTKYTKVFENYKPNVY